MMLKNKLSKIALGTLSAVAVALPMQLLADGTLGNTSTDSIAVTITKEDSVRISAMEDVDFGSESSLTVDSVLPEEFCVFASNGGYKITGTTANSSSTSFQMSAGANTLDYQLAISTIGAVASPMTPGVTVTGLTGNIIADDCLGTPNTILTLTVLADDFNAAAPGVYSDTLTMLVEPE